MKFHAVFYLCSKEPSVGPYSGNVESIYTSHIVFHIHFSIILVQLQTMQRKQESLTWSGFAGIMLIRVLNNLIEGLRWRE